MAPAKRSTKRAKKKTSVRRRAAAKSVPMSFARSVEQALGIEPMKASREDLRKLGVRETFWRAIGGVLDED